LTVKIDFLLVAGGRTVSAIIALVSLRVVTTLLEPEQYGQLGLLVAVQTFCGLLLINPIGQYINLHTHAWWDDGSLFRRLRSYKIYVLLASTIGAMGAFFTANPSDSNTIFFVLLSMFLLVSAGTWNATLISLLNMIGYRTQSMFLALATALISLVASTILVVMWRQSALAWLLGQAVGLFFGMFGAKLFFRKNIRVDLSQRPLKLMGEKKFISYCLPLALTTGLMWLQLSGYRFLVEYYWGLTQLGLLVLGLQLVGQIWVLAESVAMQFLHPLFLRRVSQYENDLEVRMATSDLMNILIPAYLLLAGLTVLSAPYLFSLLISQKFSGVTDFLITGVIIELCRVLANVIGNVAHVKRKTALLALPYGIGAIIVFSVICMSGVKHLQIYWVGVALALGSIVMFLSMIILMFRQVQFELDFKRCVVSLVSLVIMLLLAFYTPVVSGFFSIIAILLFMLIISGTALLAIIWKSPAMQRMLSIQLRGN